MLSTLGAPVSLLKKFRFEAKQSETTSVSHAFSLLRPTFFFEILLVLLCFALIVFPSIQSEAKHTIIKQSFAS